MVTAWTVKERNGSLSIYYIAETKSMVEKRLVGTHYDPTALRENPAYKHMFDKELAVMQERRGCTIVQIELKEPEQNAALTTDVEQLRELLARANASNDRWMARALKAEELLSKKV